MISQRDFLEKKLKFQMDSRHFIYFSSIPDEIQPAEKYVIRATTIIGYHCFERMDDGRVKFTGVMQNDFNLGNGPAASVGKAATLNQLPKNLKKWFGILKLHVRSMNLGGAEENGKGDDKTPKIV